MDAEPNCAICSAPPHSGCLCESERLQIALDQAESRAMDERMAVIRDWVISHARTHIQLAFKRLTSIRQHAQTAYLNSLPHYDVYMRFSGAPPIHPMFIQQLQSQIAEAHAEFKRGIDLDWRASVLRYPEVLDYFYSLVELRLPSEEHRSVMEPPFAAAGYQDRGYVAGENSKVGTDRPKRKKRRDSAGAMGHPGVHGLMRMPPPQVPSPPTQHPGYGRMPPGYY
ncbi:hypothetical protein EKO04_001250 [Ascochyta lentis]|uniref:Uncharacterized protein n=1 Tax=Ascochyta lentis TaxID=205686 RepID=A0A8H7JBL3_9PLEO|nr:hypothetical protein EKO04_001250 [Ascochyta lentis]